MRTYTLVFSILAHAGVACALLVRTVLASDEWPLPHEATVFVTVTTAPAPSIPPPARHRVEPAANPRVVPVEAPDGLHPEAVQPSALIVDDSVGSAIVSGVGSDPALIIRDEPPPSLPVVVPPAPVRVGGVVKAPQKIVHVAPVYPAIARAAGVNGVVILEATIGEDGTVHDVRVLRSIPLLDQAAAAAVRQWRFTPTLLNNHPVSVLMTVTVAFNMN